MEFKRRATMTERKELKDVGIECYDSNGSSNGNNLLGLPGVGSGLMSSQIPKFVF